MKIAVIAHIRHPIAEPFMGGMEAHCRMLCDGLRQAGHEVTLFASGRSCDRDLVAICDAPYDDVLPWRIWRGTPQLAAFQKDAFRFAWSRVLSGGFDVVHNNSLFPDIISWAVRDAVPCVTSQHVPPFGSMRDAVESAAQADCVQQTVTSAHQMTLWNARSRWNMAVVHNGVRTDRWLPRRNIGKYFVWVGRITPNKGTSLAVRAARKAGLPLHIYGPVEDAGYFASEVEPFLSQDIQYHGHVRLETLSPVVAQARGVLVTPLWDEPFGLVAAEALACGTPVCAFDNGALSEVVGECGYIVSARDVDALAAAMHKIDAIDRNSCRQRALRHFSSDAMVAGYERAYDRARCVTRGAAPCHAARTFASSQSRTAALLA